MANQQERSMAIGTITTRAATAADADHLARAAFLAGHGIFEIMFEGLVAGAAAEESFRNRRVLQPGHFSHYTRWQVAEDAAGTVVGAVNAFPNAELASCPPDPLLTAERLAPLSAMGDLEGLRGDNYYLNLVAVFPAHQGCGAGTLLVQKAIAMAREQGFPALCLTTWGDNPNLMTFYARLGFVCIAEQKIPAGALPIAGSSYVLLQRDLP